MKDEKVARKMYVLQFLEKTIQTGIQDSAANVLVELV